MKMPVIAKFVERATGQKVRGRIATSTLADILSQLYWRYDEDALDRDWNWLEVWLPCRVQPQSFVCYSARIGDELHGLMALDLRGRKVGKAYALTIDHLSTHPRDRIEQQGFKYIGVALMAVAVARSLELGMAGRIWLESLPDPKTLRFYESIGMIRQPGKSSEGYDVFVFENVRAMEFLATATIEKWINI